MSLLILYSHGVSEHWTGPFQSATDNFYTRLEDTSARLIVRGGLRRPANEPRGYGSSNSVENVAVAAPPAARPDPDPYAAEARDARIRGQHYFGQAREKKKKKKKTKLC